MLEGRTPVSKTILNAALVLFVSILAGYFLLVLSWFLLPGDLYRTHLDEALTILENEGPYPEDEYSQKLLDNFTDAIMISEASDRNEPNPFIHAASSPYVSVNGTDPYTSLLVDYYAEEHSTTSLSYARYWHGYLLSLKPVLLLLSYRQIRHLNAIVQIAMLTAIVMLLYRKGKVRFLFPFVVMVLYMGPTAIANSLQFSSVYYVTLLLLLALILFPQLTADRHRLCLFFLMSGIITAYLDFLTAPTNTLTVPLTYLCMELTARKEKGTVKLLLLCTVFWFAGYAGMWAGKWMIALIVQRGAFWETLLDSIRSRSSTQLTHTSISRIAALKRCVKMTLSNYYLGVLALSYAVFTLIDGAIRRHGILPGKEALSRALPLAVPMLIPVLWVLVLANHSYEHAHFLAFRTLCPLILCALAAVSEVSE